ARVPLVGTPIYLAPEVLQGQPASVASDVYSLGVVLFFMLTGGFPVEGTSLDGIRHAHLAGARRHVRDVRPDVSHEIGAVIDRALAIVPGQRFATAGQLPSALLLTLDRPAGRSTRVSAWLQYAISSLSALGRRIRATQRPRSRLPVPPP